MPNITRFLDAKMLGKLANLSISSKTVVEGAISGTHRSPYKGFSIEFAEHRQYVQGDDLRHLDWKVYARNEKYYVRQYEEETNLRAYVLLDCSGSMAYKSSCVSKYEYACGLTAALSYVIMKQQDSIGLVLFHEDIEDYLPPRSTLTHLTAMLKRLGETDPTQHTNTSKALHGMAEMIKRRGIIFVISDLLDSPEDVMRGLVHFKQKRHDVIVFHVLDDYELNFPFEKMTTFRDLETDEKIRVFPKAIRDEYVEQMMEFIDTYKSACFENDIDYATINTKIPIDVCLSAYLARRERVR